MLDRIGAIIIIGLVFIFVVQVIRHNQPTLISSLTVNQSSTFSGNSEDEIEYRNRFNLLINNEMDTECTLGI